MPDSNFLQNPELATTSAMTPVLEKLRGAATSTTGGLRGTSLVSTKVLPSGKELSTSTTNDIVVSTDLAFQVTVENSGTAQVLSVPVTLTIEQSKGSNITKKATIDFLNPGEQKVITFRDIPITELLHAGDAQGRGDAGARRVEHQQQLGRLPGHLLGRL